MHLKLNSEAVAQLDAIMRRKGYTNHVHTINLMLSQITKNFARHDENKQQKQSDII